MSLIPLTPLIRSFPQSSERFVTSVFHFFNWNEMEAAEAANMIRSQNVKRICVRMREISG
jgi:hypothetical protein